MVASFPQGLMLQYTSPVNLHTIILDDSTMIIVTTVTILQTKKLRLRGIIRKLSKITQPVSVRKGTQT